MNSRYLALDSTSVTPKVLHQDQSGKDRMPMDRLLTAEQVAAILSVSTAWVYDHTARKRPLLPSVRLGRAVRFRIEDVQKFIEQMTKRVA
jgi:excisionase family DNA binding protein